MRFFAVNFSCFLLETRDDDTFLTLDLMDESKFKLNRAETLIIT